MYKKLLPLLNRFVHIQQGAFSRYYEGKLISVDPDCLEIQTYQKDGTPREMWTIMLNTITEFSVGSHDLNALELKVKWAQSPEHDEIETEMTETEELSSEVANG